MAPNFMTSATNTTTLNMYTASTTAAVNYLPTCTAQTANGYGHNYGSRKARQAAKELLLDHLAPGQQRELEEHGYFHVAADCGDRFRISGFPGVQRVNEAGEVIERWCIHIPYGFPQEDCQLAQKLGIEADFDAFFEEANLEYRHEEPVAA